MTASLPCGSTVLRGTVSFHLAPLIKTQHCPSASATSSSVISVSMIICHCLSARHKEIDSHFQKQFSLIVKTNAVFSTFTINPVSRTETVLSKPCLSPCIKSFLYRSRSWNISNNKNKTATSSTFYYQWILPQTLLTSIGFRPQHSSLLPAQSRREMKNQKGEDGIQFPAIFIFSEKSLFYIGAKSQIFPCKKAHRNSLFTFAASGSVVKVLESIH